MLKSKAMSELRSCKYCNLNFTADAPRQVYCSKICAENGERVRRNSPVDRVCNVCEASYTITANALKNSKWKSTCIRCIAIIQHEEKRSVKHCIVCGIKFTGFTNQVKICSEVCRQKSHNSIQPKFKNNYTPTALALQRHGNKLPCKTCAHGKRNQHSDTGYECLANARICSPFTMMRLYKPQEIQNARN